MRIAIFGAGAIGGFLAVRLQEAGADVSVVARGPHLAAIKARGLTLRSSGVETTIHPKCSEYPEDLGPQDFVFVTLKSHALRAAAPAIAKCLGRQTALVTGINGIPYWYFFGLDCPWRDRILESIDPGGMLFKTLPPAQVIGSVVYPAAEIAEPGIIEHTYGNRISLGEPDGAKTGRVEALSKIMTKAGLKAPVRAKIRDEIWVKLWGNLAFNPMSALTGSTLDRLAVEPALRDVARRMMQEAKPVAEAFGTTFAVDIEKRIDGAGEVGPHKTSMLQDIELGRPIEIEAILGAVLELGRIAEIELPLCNALYSLVVERVRVLRGRALG